MKRAKRIEVVKTDKICWPMLEAGKSRREIVEETGISASVVARSDARRLAGERGIEEPRESIDDLRKELEEARRAAASQGVSLFDLAARVEAIEGLLAAPLAIAERRIMSILTPEWEDRLRELVAERDLYKAGCEEAALKAGPLADEEDRELTKEDEEDERERDQGLDGTLPEAANQDPEADRG